MASGAGNDPSRALTRGVRLPKAKIGLSTGSVYPESTAAAFEIAAKLGYDGVEIMVWTDPISQDAEAIRRLSDYHAVPVLAVHSPCLVITQRVWSPDPWTKLQKAREAAELLQANTVVIHPPFRWQRDYVRTFAVGIKRLAEQTDIRFAVENMFPLRLRGREISPYLPTWDVAAVSLDVENRDSDGYWIDRAGRPAHLEAPEPSSPDLASPYQHFTLDLSHTSVSGSDAELMLTRMGSAMTHLHVADGTGLNKDEHLVPGRGNQPCAQILETLADRDFAGNVIVEVNTRRAADRDEREADLAEALAFCRLYLATPALQ
ncbi:MAG TPA: sugar phosphate isomerase/epimerase [Jatrophihabitans sp.]|jgi:sugar phosphate isomerase/epimerase